MTEHDFDIEGMECDTCFGAGFEAKLLPHGHTEVKCEDCCGTGIKEQYMGYDFNPLKTWMKQDGTVLNHDDMSEEHIKACLTMIKTHGTKFRKWRGECLEPLEQALLNRFKRNEGGKILFS